MTRDDWTSAALALVGYTYPEQRYLDLVAPGDADARQLGVGSESGCMLVRLGLEEALALFPPRGPYVGGSAPRLLQARAGGDVWAPGGALRRALLATPPQPGDGLWWGMAAGAVEHVDACVIAVDCVPLSDDLLVDVVAGGQRDSAGAETVALLTRLLRWDGHRWVDVANGRPLVAVLDADLYAGAT